MILIFLLVRMCITPHLISLFLAFSHDEEKMRWIKKNNKGLSCGLIITIPYYYMNSRTLNELMQKVMRLKVRYPLRYTHQRSDINAFNIYTLYGNKRSAGSLCG